MEVNGRRPLEVQRQEVQFIRDCYNNPNDLLRDIREVLLNLGVRSWSRGSNGDILNLNLQRSGIKTPSLSEIVAGIKATTRLEPSYVERTFFIGKIKSVLYCPDTEKSEPYSVRISFNQ